MVELVIKFLKNSPTPSKPPLVRPQKCEFDISISSLVQLVQLVLHFAHSYYDEFFNFGIIKNNFGFISYTMPEVFVIISLLYQQIDSQCADSILFYAFKAGRKIYFSEYIVLCILKFLII